MSNYTKGVICVLVASALWGLSGVFAQYLFQYKGIRPEWLVTQRLLIPGAIFLFLSYMKNRRNKAKFFAPVKQDWRRIVIYGIIGISAMQMTYFLAVKYSNAPTATVIQYLSPVIVAVALVFTTRALPSKRVALAIFMALTGTFLIATQGDLSSLRINPKALIYGIASAFTAAFYAMYPLGIIARWGAIAVLGWGMLIGGIAVSIFVHPWDLHGVWDAQTVISVAYVVLLGSLVTFYLFLMGVQYIGSQLATVLCSIEPLFAAVASIAFLSVRFSVAEWAGSAFIMATVVMLRKE